MKILYLLPRVPYPLEKGDKLRAYLHARRLSRDHEVHICCLRDTPLHPEAREKLDAVCSRLSILPLNRPLILLNLFLGLFSNKPFQVLYFFQPHLKRKLQKLIETDPPDRIYCQLIRSSEYVKDLHRIPKTIDYMDAFSKGLERRMERSSLLFRLLLNEECRRTKRYEHLIYDHFDQHLIISEQDREQIPHPSRDRIHVIPNGIDAEHFQPREAKKDKDLLFTGNMAYPPNIESARFLVERILPLVEKEGGELQTLIAGVSPTRRVKELSSENVEVSGWVEDIRDAYARSRIFIAPMVMGTGLQNKLLEAMAMGLPCITTPLANESLGAQPDETILVANDAEGLANKIHALLRDPELSQRIADNGRDFVLEHFDLERTGDRLADLLTGRTFSQDADPGSAPAGFP